ncbi:MAG: DUF962 domain-containing protein [Chitinophagales bacterium]
MPKQYQTFREFYPFYLTQHARPVNRLMHFIGTGLVIAMLIAGIVTGKWWLLALLPVAGYGFAWVGHFFMEKNRPATFTYPFYSLASDFVMFWHILTGQISEKMKEAHRLEGIENKWE